MGVWSSFLPLAALWLALVMVMLVPATGRSTLASARELQENSACVESEWSTWGSCIRVKGRLVQVKTRTVISDKDPTKPCDHLEESRPCVDDAEAGTPAVKLATPPAKSTALKSMVKVLFHALPAAIEDNIGKVGPTTETFSTANPDAAAQQTRIAQAKKAVAAFRKKVGDFKEFAEEAADTLKGAAEYSASGKIVYDGSNGYYFKVSVTSSDDDSVVDKINDLFDSILFNAQPWLELNEDLADKQDALMALSFGYDTETHTGTLEASSGNYMFIIDSIKERLAAEIGIELPESTSESSGNTGRLQVVVSRVAGLEVLSLGLTGTWTPASLGKRLGFSWPIPDDVITVSGVTFEYIAAESSLTLAVTASIPSAGITDTNAALTVKGTESFALAVEGEINPVSWLTINSITFEISKEGGVQGAASGVIADIPFDVSIGVVNKVTSFSLTATDVKIGKIIGDVVTKQLKIDVPKVLLDIISPIKFHSISMTYVNKTLSFAASPDISGVPILESVVKVAKVKPTDFSLNLDSSGLVLMVSKKVLIAMPDPFVGDGEVLISARVDTDGLGFFGDFTSAIKIPGVKENPVKLTVGAGISADSSFTLRAGILSPISLEKFPAFEISYLTISSSFLPTYPVPTLKTLLLSGKTLIAGANVDIDLVFDPDSAQMAYKCEVTNLQLGEVLNAFGLKMSLGVASDFTLEKLKISYATVDIPKLDIQQGMFFLARLKAMGMVAETAFEVTLAGTQFSLSFEAPQVNKIFQEAVTALLDSRLTEYVEDLARNGKKELEAAFTRAKADLQEKQDAVEAARKKFAAAIDKANAGLVKAEAAAVIAGEALEAARRTADAKLAKARTEAAAAELAFTRARDAANRDLASAITRVQKAREDFERAMSSARNQLNDAIATVNSLTADYNYHDGKCDRKRCLGKVCVSRNPQNCIAKGAVWATMKTAEGAVIAAREIMDKVAGGAARGALTTAELGVSAAEAAVNTVLSGPLARAAAAAADVLLQAAAEASEGILKGTAFATNKAAQETLDAAQKVVKEVIEGADAIALQSAEGLLSGAEQIVKATEVAANAPLDLVISASKAAASALKQVENGGFIQFGAIKLSAKFEGSKAPVIGVEVTVSINKKPLTLKVSLDLSDPASQIKTAVFDKGWDALMDAFF